MRFVFALLIAPIISFGVPAFAPLSATAQADEALLKKGAKVFKKCKACHQVGEGAKNTVGPVLNNIVDRPAATADGYKYSKAMIAAGEGGMVWDEANLATYLTKPKNLVPKTKMSFVGLKKESDRQAVIAYLKTFEAE